HHRHEKGQRERGLVVRETPQLVADKNQDWAHVISYASRRVFPVRWRNTLSKLGRVIWKCRLARPIFSARPKTSERRVSARGVSTKASSIVTSSPRREKAGRCGAVSSFRAMRSAPQTAAAGAIRRESRARVARHGR